MHDKLETWLLGRTLHEVYTDAVKLSFEQERIDHGSSEDFNLILTQVNILTRRVAVCLWTHCNIGSKSVCCPLASDVEL